MIKGRTGVSVFLAAIACLAGVVWGVSDFRTSAAVQEGQAGGARVAAAQRPGPLTAVPMPSATVDLVIDFNGVLRGYYSMTEDGDAFNPFTVLSTGFGDVTVLGNNSRGMIGGRNAAVIFDTAEPHVDDLDIGSPNETCDPPGPGVSVDGTGEFDGAWPNCPDTPLEKGLIIATNLRDVDGDDLIDEPNDEGIANNNPQFTFDFSDIGPVTLVEMAILDKEEGAATVQMYNAGGVMVGFVGDIVTGDNGLDPARSLGPTAGVSRMVVALNGSGLIDNIRFQVEEGEPCIDIRKQAEGPDTRVFPSGSDVDFEIEVSICGDVDLSDVAVTDAQIPGCAITIGELPVGQSVIYSCTAPDVTQSFTTFASRRKVRIPGCLPPAPTSPSRSW
jgi:hypothetical protein